MTVTHHTFMQALMARGAMAEADACELYRRIHRRADGARTRNNRVTSTPL